MKIELEDIVHMQETCLTVRGSRRRTTIPGELLEFFRLGNGDKIKWVLLKDGTLLVVPSHSKHR